MRCTTTQSSPERSVQGPIPPCQGCRPQGRCADQQIASDPYRSCPALFDLGHNHALSIGFVMTLDTPSSPDHLWDFALAVYRCDGVPPACLHLQDQCAVDVPLLLAAGFAACTARQFDRVAYDALQDLAGNWQQQIVTALRIIRRHLKTGPHPAPNTATDHFVTR